MRTTTIRVDTATHQQLVELGRATGETLVDTVRAAAEALRRERFARRVVAELDELRRDPAAWNGYLADGEETTVTDGLD
jgi:hypothetical protein